MDYVLMVHGVPYRRQTGKCRIKNLNPILQQNTVPIYCQFCGMHTESAISSGHFEIQDVANNISWRPKNWFLIFGMLKY
jgi:hypothetical protein